MHRSSQTGNVLQDRKMNIQWMTLVCSGFYKESLKYDCKFMRFFFTMHFSFFHQQRPHLIQKTGATKVSTCIWYFVDIYILYLCPWLFLVHLYLNVKINHFSVICINKMRTGINFLLIDFRFSSLEYRNWDKEKTAPGGTTGSKDDECVFSVVKPVPCTDKYGIL